MIPRHRIHAGLVLLLGLAALPAGCGDKKDSNPAPAATHEELLAQALVGVWQLDPTDKKEYIRLLPSGDFGGIVTYNGLTTANNPKDVRSRVAGKWKLEGSLLTFQVTESDNPDLQNRVVQHRVLSIDGGVMKTIFEGEHRMEIFRRR